MARARAGQRKVLGYVLGRGKKVLGSPNILFGGCGGLFPPG
jgi:hypothetical protein